MTFLSTASQIIRRIVVAIANRTTRKARRYLYKLKIRTICHRARIVAPDLAQSFSGHIFEGGSKELTLFGSDIAEAAERIVQGSFVLFGAWVEMPETLRRSDVRWYTDILSGARFNLADYTDLRPKTEVADIKVPWEYGRMHRLIPLAATFGARGDRRYLNLYRDEVEGFYDANPLGTGVQWVCAMEVGIRAFNLLASYELLRNMLPIDDELHELIAEMAICHGEHIWANLETSARLQENNHYIADLLGLAAIVSCFPDAPKSKKWGSYVRRELLRCVRKQVLDDGCCFERSTRYTRLVGEMLFYAGKALTNTPYELEPEYIESYDISNWGDGTSVGGMIVFENGKPKKSGYRKFKIRSVLGTDDYGSMAEVLTRRVQEYEKGTSGQFGEKPDLILLDGGKGQVSVVKRVLQGTPLQDVPLFGMVKDDKHRTRAIVTAQGEEIAISMHKGVFGFITSIQDEVHRFSIQYQRQSQKKKSYASSLTQIAGVGPATAKALLNHFRSVGAVRQATIEELQQVKGLSKKVAQNIWEEFHPADEQQ